MKKNLMSWLMILAGIALIASGVIFGRPAFEDFAKRNFYGWKEVEGEYSSQRTQVEGSNVLNFETFSYVYDDSGRRQEIEINLGAKKPQWTDTIKIWYNPENPADAVAGEYNYFHLAILALPILGLISMIWGVIRFRKARKMISKTPQNNFENSKSSAAPLVENSNPEMKIMGNISDVEMLNSANGKPAGRAVVMARLPNGEMRKFLSEPIEGLTAGLLVRYLANPVAVSISVHGENYDDYYLSSEEVLLAFHQSFALSGNNLNSQDKENPNV
ncbi:MAG: DUF3592 domain-containing protein [bacterium]|nr:DUF3592 domain-containing protein [bacterium]